jgi:integrase
MLRLHGQGRTAATLLLGKGVHPKIVQEMLGHSTITQTMDTYSHLLPDMQDRAVSAMESALRS